MFSLRFLLYSILLGMAYCSQLTMDLMSWILKKWKPVTNINKALHKKKLFYYIAAIYSVKLVSVTIPGESNNSISLSQAHVRVQFHWMPIDLFVFFIVAGFNLSAARK